MALDLPTRGTVAHDESEYAVEPADTDTDVDTFSTSVETHPELAAIRNRLAHGSITTTEIRDELTRANPALLDNLRAAKAESARRRNKRR